MKINLSRFRNIGSVVGKKFVQLPNGNEINKTVTKFQFVYADLHQTINTKLSNLGSTNAHDILIATMDPRFEPYISKLGSDQIQLGNLAYRISDVSKDDSNISQILYEVTLTKVNGNSGGGF